MTPGARGLASAAHLLALLLLAASCARTDTSATAPPPWVSRAIPEARGDVTTLPDGTRRAVRYRGWTTDDFGRFRTYDYQDTRPEPAPATAAMPSIAGDPATGRRLFLDRSRGP